MTDPAPVAAAEKIEMLPAPTAKVAALTDQARFLAQQARDPAPHYEHTTLGYNYRLSNICAAIARGQLAVLDERVAARRSVFERYHAGLGDLPGIDFMPEAGYGRCTRWLTVMLIDAERFGADPEAIRCALESENIEARPVWKPMHMQPVFSQARRVGGAISEDCQCLVRKKLLLTLSIILNFK